MAALLCRAIVDKRLLVVAGSLVGLGIAKVANLRRRRAGGNAKQSGHAYERHAQHRLGGANTLKDFDGLVALRTRDIEVGHKPKSLSTGGPKE